MCYERSDKIVAFSESLADDFVDAMGGVDPFDRAKEEDTKHDEAANMLNPMAAGVAAAGLLNPMAVTKNLLGTGKHLGEIFGRHTGGVGEVMLGGGKAGSTVALQTILQSALPSLVGDHGNANCKFV